MSSIMVQEPKMEPHLTALEAENLELLRSGYNADVMIRCEDSTWYCHATILFPRSKWFEACLTSIFEENQTAIIDFHEVDPAAVGRLLQYLYTMNATHAIGDEPTYRQLYQLYKVADMLNFLELADEVKKAMAVCLRRFGRSSMYEEYIALIDFVSMIYTDGIPALAEVGVAGIRRLGRSCQMLRTLEDKLAFYAVPEEMFEDLLEQVIDMDREELEMILEVLP